jgi:hypothetical protein
MKQVCATTILALATLVLPACSNKSDSSGTKPSGSNTVAAPPQDATVVAPAADAANNVRPAAPDPKAAVAATLPTIRKIAADPVVVKAIQVQNSKKMTMDAIKKLDTEWMAATGVTPMMKPYLENKCAEALKKYITELPAIVEAFAMDDQGGLVCTVYRTTDYWQGDEAKWQKSFLPNAEFIDKAMFDESSQTYSVQVSLPVTDHGHPIGAITIGLGLDKL